MCEAVIECGVALIPEGERRILDDTANEETKM
jgi:hypothetical protein